MSRLDAMIHRLTTQRACLEWAAAAIEAVPGPVLEFGLGNGRTYDHLRHLMPGRDLFVFDRQIAAHPDCIPPADRVILGEFRETAPAAVCRFEGRVALIHGDIGSSDAQASRELAAALAPHWLAMLRFDGLLLSDQPLTDHCLAALTDHRLTAAPLPVVTPARYFIFRPSR